MKENIADFEKKRENILKQNYKLKAQISIYISNDGENYRNEWYSEVTTKEIYDILEKILKDIRKGLNQFEYEKSDAYNLSFSILYYEKTKHDFKYIFNPSNISKEIMFKYLYTTIILYKITNGIL
jgi:hypothetical protein